MPFLTSNPFSSSISKAIERKRFRTGFDTIDDIGPPQQRQRWAQSAYPSPRPVMAAAFRSRIRNPSPSARLRRNSTPMSDPLYAPVSPPRVPQSLSPRRRHSPASVTRGRSRTPHSRRRSHRDLHRLRSPTPHSRRHSSTRDYRSRPPTPRYRSRSPTPHSRRRSRMRSPTPHYRSRSPTSHYPSRTPSVRYRNRRRSPTPHYRSRSRTPHSRRHRPESRTHSQSQPFSRRRSHSRSDHKYPRLASVSPARRSSRSRRSREYTRPPSHKDSVAQPSNNSNGSAVLHHVMDDAVAPTSSDHQSKEKLHVSSRFKRKYLSNLDPEHFPHRFSRASSLTRLSSGKDSFELQESIWVFITDILPRQIYLHCLLRLPYLYFTRVTRIFEQVGLTIEEIKDMALKASAEDTQAFYDNITSLDYNAHHDATTLSPSYQRLKQYWEAFVDSMIREWKTLNIISALLLSAIMTMFQIPGAASDPVTRYVAFWSLICALLSLLYGCLYIIRFSGMRKAHKAAEWALEAEKNKTSILWNIWVMLAMPVIWLTWSIILYIVCIMCFMWRVRASDANNPTFQVTATTESVLRIFVCFVLGIGVTYGVLIIHTLRCYGSTMDEAWKRRVDGYIALSHLEKPTRPRMAPPSVISARPTIPVHTRHAHYSTPRSSSGSSILQHMPALMTKEIKPKSDRDISSRASPSRPPAIIQQPLESYSMPPRDVSESSTTSLPRSVPLENTSPQKDALPPLPTSITKGDIESHDEIATSLVKQEPRVIMSPSPVSSSDRPNPHPPPQIALSHKTSTDSGGSTGILPNMFHHYVNSPDDLQPKDDRNRPIERIQKTETPSVSRLELHSTGTSLKETSLPSLEHINAQRDDCDLPPSTASESPRNLSPTSYSTRDSQEVINKSKNNVYEALAR